jgi:peptidoglycan/LPS O-acetylase OafA/YrhL
VGSSEIRALTSLRGIAAMAVMALHFSATMQQNASGSFPALAPRGELAVDVFFVLSGFIMAYTYLPLFSAEPTGTAYRTFLLKRAARILPLNIVVTGFVIVAALLLAPRFGFNPFPRVRLDHAGEDFLSNALMLPGFGIGHSVNLPAWSIAVEFAAYFLFPILLGLVFKAGREGVVIAVAGASALLFAVCATGLHFSPDALPGHGRGWRDLCRCLSEFTLGLATYRLFLARPAAEFFKKDAVCFAVSAVIVALIAVKADEYFVLLFFPALVLSLALNEGLPARLLGIRPIYFLGVISYSLYLIHDTLRELSAMIVRHYHPALLSPRLAMAMAALCSVAVIPLAWVSYVLVERPGRTFVRNLRCHLFIHGPWKREQIGTAWINSTCQTCDRSWLSARWRASKG